MRLFEYVPTLTVNCICVRFAEINPSRFSVRFSCVKDTKLAYCGNPHIRRVFGILITRKFTSNIVSFTTAREFLRLQKGYLVFNSGWL